MGIEYRADKNVPIAKLLELYRAGDFNEWWTERNARAMLQHCWLIITAWNGEQLIGTVTAVSDGVNYAMIDDLVVHPAFRGQGVGTRLMEELLARITPLNLDFVQLVPVPGRESFFQRLRFGVIPDHTVMELSSDRGGSAKSPKECADGRPGDEKQE